MVPTDTLDYVHSMREKLELTLRRAGIIVALLGKGESGLVERRRIASVLRTQGVIALVPEDDFPKEAGPSLVEPAVLSESDVDLVFLNVDSWGSAVEFGGFHRHPAIAPKLRVLVSPDHHPLHSPMRGYLMDLYLTHLAAFGHVYPVDGKRRVPLL